MKIKVYTTHEGKIWKSKATGELLSETLHLGKEDTIENYEEVDQPIEEI